ncbi:MAG: ThiF family adenylyltransferase, partial [Deltaproteobacteria bacterium]|nr:ThiF family adenylyltransferase [Deltaproteobacteria bacterium]
RVVLDGAAARDVAAAHGVGLKEVQLAALEENILPVCYLRNPGIISPAEQKKLLSSCVAVVGAGGLGGTVIIILARMGVGRLIVCDGDVFEESNLNRQWLCFHDNLGRPKAQVAAETVARINPAVEVMPVPEFLTELNAADFLQEAQVVVDALDNVPSRLIVERAARSLNVPL